MDRYKLVGDASKVLLDFNRGWLSIVHVVIHEQYNFLQSGGILADGKDDKADFVQTLKSFKLLGFEGYVTHYCQL